MAGVVSKLWVMGGDAVSIQRRAAKLDGAS
jgi:hypothetical protein